MWFDSRWIFHASIPRLTFYFDDRSALEEINVRSNLALAQKQFLSDIEGADAEEQDLLKMTAQVVSLNIESGPV